MSTPADFTAGIAADPATPAPVLAQIAQYRPDLLVALASNPGLYPALRAWLSTSTDPRIHQALAWSAQQAAVATSQPMVEQSPAPGTQQGPFPPTAGPTQAAPLPPPPPPAFGAPAGEASSPQPGAGRAHMKPGVLAAVVVVVALVLGGGAFAALRTFGGGGYASPDAAASALDKAIAEKNVLGLAGLIAPSELSVSDAARAAYDDDAPSTGFDPDKMVGPDELKEYNAAITVASSKMTYTVVEEHDDLAVINISSWNLDARIDPGLASTLEQNYQQAKGEALTDEERAFFENLDLSDASFDGDVVDEMDGVPLRLVTVREDGRWYISLSMSMMEALYQEATRNGDDSDLSQPDYAADFGSAPGADSPEEAVESFGEGVLNARSISDVAGTDVAGVLTLPERRLAMVYAPVLSSVWNGGDSLGDHLEISWDLTSQDVDGTRVVSPGSTTVTFTEDPDDEDDTTTIRFNGTAFAAENSWSGSTLTMDVGQGLTNPERIGLVTVKERGAWYLSLGDSVSNFLALRADSASVTSSVHELTGNYLDDEQVNVIEDVPQLGAFVVIFANVLEGTDNGRDNGNGGGESAASGASSSVTGSCIGGDMYACDNYFLTADAGSEDKFIGQTCGYRDYNTVGGECVELYGSTYSDY